MYTVFGGMMKIICQFVQVQTVIFKNPIQSVLKQLKK